jgi:iron(III) transport system permease protein
LAALLISAALVALVGWPALTVLSGAWGEGASAGGFEAARPAHLAVESLKLVGLTELLAVPAGAWLGWVLFRSDVLGRRALRLLVAMLLFLPLPLQALAWLGSFGNAGRSQFLGSSPILTGLVGAAAVHAVAALPWVVLIAGVGFRTVERELEESARLDLGRGRVFWRVSLRRALGPLAGAALATAVLTAGEMTVTDMLNLRTYAEEAYTLSQQGSTQAHLAVRATWPQWLVLGTLVLTFDRVLLRADPSRLLGSDRPIEGGAGPNARLRRSLLPWMVVGGLVGLPLCGLAWRAGRVGTGLVAGRGASWSARGLAQTLGRAWGDLVGADLSRLTLVQSLAWAALGASLSVALAWGLGWKARGSRAWRLVAGLVIGLLLAAPGPVVGLALKLAYARVRILQVTPGLMVMGYVARTLPYATLILSLAVRAVPGAYLDAAEVDGLGPVGRAWRVALPLTRGALAASWCLAFALAIGELPTAYVARAPRADPVSLYVWSMLHNGVESQLAGVGLILEALVAGLGILGCLSLGLAVRSLRAR